jgi:hypothetical protein
MPDILFISQQQHSVVMMRNTEAISLKFNVAYTECVFPQCSSQKYYITIIIIIIQLFIYLFICLITY